MRAFVIVLCLASSVYAGSLGGGYDYPAAASVPAPAPVYSQEASLPIVPAAPELTKEFYTYTAPEGSFNDNIDTSRLSDSLHRSLRVIFIRGPENTGLESAAAQLAKSAGEQQTAIYVLNKQAGVSDLANKLNSLNHNNANKPEVHFVKYRTPADAANAQHAIQSQYDSLGGSSSSHNGGVAPVLDFASKPAAPVAAPSNSYIPPQSAYLPPGRRV